MPPCDARQILDSAAGKVNGYLREVLHSYELAPRRVIEAVEYSLFAGGKRLRPALVIESFRACGGTDSKRGSALAAAGAVELIHTFSLVHDDLPAMDDDDLRRGKPTNHKVFGDAMAILAGDAMTSVAFEILARDATPGTVPALVRELASAAGPCGMIGGQVIDMEGQNTAFTLESLKKMHRMKTGALLTASVRMGAICAEADESTLRCATDFGRHVGLAFQIIDDLLDVTATPEQMGKATGKDVNRGKNTYPALLGINATRDEARRQLQSAITSLSPLGAAAQGLETLARFIVERDA